MVDEHLTPHENDPYSIDPQVARVARMEDFLVGGEAHFAADRAAAEAIAALSPGGLEGLRGLVQTVKDFVLRAVRFVAGEAGVPQFLHVGMSTPTSGMVHHVAQQITKQARVVYVSYDPTTLAHVHELRMHAAEGTVGHVQSTFDDTETILRGAAATLDLSQPVAVVLPTSLTLVVDDDVAHRVVDDLHAAVVPGSYLIFAHTTLDIAPDGTAKAIERFNETLGERYAVRGKGEIVDLLAGYDLVEPGLVPIEHWRPDSDPPTPHGRRPYPVYGAVGRKPAIRRGL
jgi:hypothetical protein